MPATTAPVRSSKPFSPAPLPERRHRRRGILAPKQYAERLHCFVVRFGQRPEPPSHGRLRRACQFVVLDPHLAVGIHHLVPERGLVGEHGLTHGDVLNHFLDGAAHSSLDPETLAPCLAGHAPPSSASIFTQTWSSSSPAGKGH